MWKMIEDDKVFHIWKDSYGVEHSIPPTFYEDNGIPVDGETGDDMTYLRTEIFVE